MLTVDVSGQAFSGVKIPADWATSVTNGLAHLARIVVPRCLSALQAETQVCCPTVTEGAPGRDSGLQSHGD